MLNAEERIGDWIVIDKLGEGGMGAVYRCRNVMSDRIQAAVKVVKPHSLADEKERFIREVEALDHLRHRSVVRVKGWGEDEQRGLLWLAMDMVRGQDLEKRLAQGALAVDEAVPLFHTIAEGLAHAHHHGIFHRDIKPANIILCDDGSARIVDFGIAVQKGRTRLTAMGMIPGTPAYMAPEIFAGDSKPVPSRVDVYALGQVLYEAITGTQAYPEDGDALSTGQRLVQLMGKKLSAEALDPGPRFDDALREVIQRATDPEPDTRLPDMASFAAGLAMAPAVAASPEPPAAEARAPAVAPSTKWVRDDLTSKPERTPAQDTQGRPRPPDPEQPPPPPAEPSGGRSGRGRGAAVALGVSAMGMLGIAAAALAVLVLVVVGVVAWRASQRPVVATPVTRDVQVAVTGLTAGTPTKVLFDGGGPSDVTGMAFTFTDRPRGWSEVWVAAGPGCTEARLGGVCPGCCSCASQSVQVTKGEGTQYAVIDVAPPAPPGPRPVRLTAPGVADGWSVSFDLGGRDGPSGSRIDDRTRLYDTVDPGTYELRAEVGRCKDADLGCWGSGTCPAGCASYVADIEVPCGGGEYLLNIDLPTPSATGTRPVEVVPSPRWSQECKRGCPSGAVSGGTLADGQRVQIVGIHPDDAYCGQTIVGVSGRVSGDLHSNDGCWMGGGMIADDGTDYYFYKAAVKATGSAPAPSTTGCVRTCPSGAVSGGSLYEGQRVEVLAVHPDDAYCGSPIVGVKGRVSGDLHSNDGCWMGGGMIADDGTDYYFYMTAFRSLGGPAPKPSTRLGYTGATVYSGAGFTILDVHPDDAYYSDRASLIGLVCTATDAMSAMDTGLFAGPAVCSNGGDYYFYKVSVALN